MVAALPRLLLVLQDALRHHFVQEENHRRPRLAIRMVLQELVCLTRGYPGPTRIVQLPDVLHKRRLIGLEEGEKPLPRRVEYHTLT